MAVYSLIYEYIFIHVRILILIFIANFNSNCPSSIIGTLFWNRRIFSLSLDLFLEFFLAIFLFVHSLDCLVDCMCRPYKVYCMHPFLRPLFLDECTRRCLFLLFVLTVIAIIFMAI